MLFRSDAPRLVDEAMRQLHTGRPRPVEIEMPMDVMASRATVTTTPAPDRRPSEPCAAAPRSARGTPALPRTGAGGLDDAHAWPTVRRGGTRTLPAAARRLHRRRDEPRGGSRRGGPPGRYPPAVVYKKMFQKENCVGGGVDSLSSLHV